MQRRSAPPNLISNLFSKKLNISNKITNEDSNKFELENPSVDNNQLLISIEALRSITTFTLKTAEAQEKSANSLEKWVKQTTNNAIGDIVGWTCELLRVHAEQQRTFADNYDHFLEEFKKVFEIERDLQEEEQKIKKLAENERSLNFDYNNENNNNKEESRKFLCLLKSTSSSPKNNKNEVKGHWYDTIGELMVREEEVEKKREKAEIIKMEYLRLALKGISNSYCNFANITNLIFSCQTDLAEFIPKVSTTEDLRNMNYDGIPKTRKIMKKLEKELFDKKIKISYFAPSIPQDVLQLRRRSEPLSSTSNKFIIKNDLVQRIAKTSLNKTNKKQQFVEIPPPPPYTPSAPTVEQIESSEDEKEEAKKEKEEYPRSRIYPQLSPSI